MELRQTVMVIADISGYTKFISLHRVSLIHAEVIITDLLSVVTQSAQFPLKLNRLEGDAAFLYCDELGEDLDLAVADIAKQIEAMMSAFAIKHRDLLDRSVGGCVCDACQHVEVLRLKAFAHLGEVVFKEVNNFTELGGEAPIIIHRLTKNSVQSNEYVLVTEAFAKHLDQPIYPHQQPGRDDYDSLGSIPYVVYYPQPRDLSVPKVARLSRLTGILEAFRLFWRGLTARPSRRARPFRNLPS
ncbi:MAG: DUF2652 domain-containing protein [Rhodospirillaceae bacterium]